jgi:[acyl-carrier-protein] S-malonyltransferase
MAVAKEKGAKRAVMLPMSAPSHCSLMKPAADRLADRLTRLAMVKPRAPVVQNRDVQAFDDPARIKQALVEQLYNPVRWIETVQFLAAHGVTRMVECGPGKVLTGLSRRIAGEAEVIAINDSAALAAAATQGQTSC